MIPFKGLWTSSIPVFCKEIWGAVLLNIIPPKQVYSGGLSLLLSFSLGKHLSIFREVKWPEEILKLGMYICTISTDMQLSDTQWMNFKSVLTWSTPHYSLSNTRPRFSAVKQEGIEIQNSHGNFSLHSQFSIASGGKKKRETTMKPEKVSLSYTCKVTLLIKRRIRVRCRK